MPPKWPERSRPIKEIPMVSGAPRFVQEISFTPGVGTYDVCACSSASKCSPVQSKAPFFVGDARFRECPDERPGIFSVLIYMLLALQCFLISIE